MIDGHREFTCNSVNAGGNYVIRQAADMNYWVQLINKWWSAWGTMNPYLTARQLSLATVRGNHSGRVQRKRTEGEWVSAFLQSCFSRRLSLRNLLTCWQYLQSSQLSLSLVLALFSTIPFPSTKYFALCVAECRLQSLLRYCFASRYLLFP